MNKKEYGLKELVKLKGLTAKSALSCLMVKADRNKESSLVKKSQTYRWLLSKL